jgi:hypothetical protein
MVLTLSDANFFLELAVLHFVGYRASAVGIAPTGIDNMWSRLNEALDYRW